MKIAGAVAVPHPVEQVWEAILDPAVLVRTIPGCSRLEVTGEHSYAMTVSAGVAAIKGTYDGTCALTDLVPHESLRMRLVGAGAPGTVDATVDVTFAAADGGTTISYDADAIVGGMVGGVGQRMLTSVSKRMAAEFFGNVADAIATPGEVGGRAGGGLATPSPGGSGSSTSEGFATPEVFTRPPAPTGSQGEFVKGIAVGAGLVLLGVVAGRWLGGSR